MFLGKVVAFLRNISFFSLFKSSFIDIEPTFKVYEPPFKDTERTFNVYEQRFLPCKDTTLSDIKQDFS